MPFNNLTSRSDVAALIPEEVSNILLTDLASQSAAMTLFTRVNVPRNQVRMPVLSALPTAYFVTGDTGLKQTTEMAWSNKYLNVEEIAAILPIPDNVVADIDADAWGTAMPLLVKAIGRVLDAAVFFGTNKPSNWPAAIVTAAVAAGNHVNRSTNATADGGIAEDINDVMATVEADGFDVNGFVAARTFRKFLRGARDADGQRLLDIDGNVDSVEGVRVSYAMPGLWPVGSGSAELVAGDYTQAILGVRQDITFKMFDQGVIQDNTGAVQFNLMQQDMMAMRVTFRCAYEVANPLTYEQAVEGSRFPFGVLRTP